MNYIESLHMKHTDIQNKSWEPVSGDLWLIDDKSPRNKLCRLLILTVDNSTIISIMETGAEMQFKSIGAFSNYIRSGNGILLARKVRIRNYL